MRRVLLLILFVLSAVLTLRAYRPQRAGGANAPGDAGPNEAAIEPVTSAEPAIEYRDQRPQNVFAVTPAAMPEALRSSYRLRPDRRVLLAVLALHSFTTTGESEPRLAVDFLNGRWHLGQDGRRVGELSELASFEDAWTLLTGVAATAPPTAQRSANDLTRARSALDDFSVRRLADALGMAGTEWRAGGRNQDVLRIAVHGLLGMALQGHDPLEQNDALLGRALAATVLLDRLGADTGRERALLADLLGYSREARRIATGLVASDPIRAFVLREHATLRGLAEQPGASRFVRHLYLIRLAERGDVQEWSAWVADHNSGTPYDLGLFRSAFLLHDFAGNAALSSTAPYLVLLEAWRAAHPKGIPERLLRRALDESDPRFAMAFGVKMTGGQPARLLGEFEATLRDVGLRQSGPFLDSLAYRDFFRGYMYGAFVTYSRFVIDQLSSVQATEDLVAALDSAPPGLGVEIARWNRALLGSMHGTANLDELLATLAERRVGSSALDRTFDELKDRAHWSDRRVLAGVRQLALRLDARPANVSRFATVAYSDLLDMRLAGQLYTHLDRVAGDTHPLALVWLNRMRGDGAAIRRLAEDSTLDFDDRAYALTTLAATEGVADADVRAAFEQLMREDPLGWDMRRTYIDYLEERDDYAGAGRVAEYWLDSEGRSGGFDEIFARTALARSLERRGSLDSALTVIRPVVGSEQSGAMERAAIIHARLGNSEPAVRIAHAAVQRYSSVPHAYARLAEVHWILGDHAAAAAVLVGAANRLTLEDWASTVGESLYHALGDRPPSEAARAAEALVAAGVDPSALRQLSRGFAHKDRFAHAFEFSSRASVAHPLSDIDLKTTAYHHLRRARGEPAARAWLEARIPPDTRNLASIIFYRDHWSLLWDLIPEPESGPYTSSVWLYRAGAAVQEGFAKHPRREAILSYYAQASDDPYDTMGRYLVGLAGEAEILALVTAPDRLCEVAYYLGLRAAAEGRYAAATDWLRIVRETGLSQEGEYAWATDLLNDWRAAGTLTRFAEQPEDARAARTRVTKPGRAPGS